MAQELKTIGQEVMNGMSNEELLGLLRDATVSPECATYAITIVQTRIAEAAAAKEAAEKEAAAAKAAAKASNGRTIKANNAGGLFIRDPSFKCYSADKSKEYVGCLNVDPDLFRCLLANDGLLNDIRAFLKDSGLTKFPTAPAVKPQPTDNGNSGATVANSLVATAPLAGRTKK